MGSFALPFVILPGACAVAVGWAVTDWRLAGALAAGAFGLVFLLPVLGVPETAFLMPVLWGAGIGAAILLPLLHLRPATTVWTRMTLALVAAVVTGFALFMTGAGIA